MRYLRMALGVVIAVAVLVPLTVFGSPLMPNRPYVRWMMRGLPCVASVVGAVYVRRQVPRNISDEDTLSEARKGNWKVAERWYCSLHRVGQERARREIETRLNS